MSAKLGIGTVQFGLDYGISNKEGKTTPEEVEEILHVASENRIRFIDTAALYGSSEEVLGKSLPLDHKFDVITKTAKFTKDFINSDDVQLLEDTFYRSLQKLRQPSLYGLLIHDAQDLLKKDGRLLMEKMVNLKRQGLVKKIGVSIYTGQHIDQILNNYRIDMIQLPINIFDQRLLFSGHISKLKKYEIEIHARSLFLQGLLLMDIGCIPPCFDTIRNHLKNYHIFLHTEGISPLQAAIGFVMGLDEIDAAICGINNHHQLQEICAVTKPLRGVKFDDFAVFDESIVNPSKWVN
ncbi:MAG: aldo/keto reductase [Candidatus Brocadiaceae bacterium]